MLINVATFVNIYSSKKQTSIFAPNAQERRRRKSITNIYTKHIPFYFQKLRHNYMYFHAKKLIKKHTHKR